jgi:hypothetical protein
MSEHKKINIEALRYLLRYGRKVSGPWDDVDMADDEWMADDDDADLLAAAPELLEALEAMEETVNQVVSGIRNGSTVEWVALLTKAQAAIRKATGEQ